MKFERLWIVVIWLLAIASWEAAYRVLQWKPYVFPAPSHVADATLKLVGVETTFGDSLSTEGWPFPAPLPPEIAAKRYKPLWLRPLPVAVAVSGVRLVVGFSIAIVIGSALGLLTWRFRFMDRLLGPVFLGLQTLPSVVWVPLAVMLLGLNERGLMFVMVMGSCFGIAISLRDGLRTLPPIYRNAGMMLGARGWRLYRYVLLPASLPPMASSLRQGFSFAWRSLMGGELLIALKFEGLGFQLDLGRNFGDPAHVVTIMIAMIVIGMLADRWVFARFEARVRERFGLV